MSSLTNCAGQLLVDVEQAQAKPLSDQTAPPDSLTLVCPSRIPSRTICATADSSSWSARRSATIFSIVQTGSPPDRLQSLRAILGRTRSLRSVRRSRTLVGT